eukprot:7284366-Prymnesium_polylepis.1
MCVGIPSRHPGSMERSLAPCRTLANLVLAGSGEWCEPVGKKKHGPHREGCNPSRGRMYVDLGTRAFSCTRQA